MKARNPILPLDYYCPDGDPHVVNNELFVYPSFDVNDKDYCSDKLYVVHSKDLSDFKTDGPSFDTSEFNWEPFINYPAGLAEANSYKELPDYFKAYLPKIPLMPFKMFKKIVLKICERSALKATRKLYAPDAITIGDKSYLFFCTSDGYEGVAVSDKPQGPFHDPVMITSDKTGKPISGIDPSVFQDDDGKVYLYWGQISSYGAELTADLTKIKEDTLRRGLVTENGHSFHEASSVRKINGIYYYVFADSKRGKPTSLGYATSSSPLGPFTYQGIIIDNAECDPSSWNNHGGIACMDGKWYIFYHRSTNNSRYLRRMCAEPIYIDEKGFIKEVLPTSIGLGEPYKKNEKLPAYQACKLKNAYIRGDKLIINKGESLIIFRYLDKECFAVSSVSADVKADISFEIAENGELSIRINSKEKKEISYFEMK